MNRINIVKSKFAHLLEEYNIHSPKPISKPLKIDKQHITSLLERLFLRERICHARKTPVDPTLKSISSELRSTVADLLLLLDNFDYKRANHSLKNKSKNLLMAS